MRPGRGRYEGPLAAVGVGMTRHPPAASQPEPLTRQERTDDAFRRIQRFLDLDSGEVWGRRPPAVLTRLKDALAALRDYRRAHNQPNFGDYEEKLAVRIVADQFAEDIADAAGGRTDLDPHTVAWVLAGIRCPWRPFCRGCQGCFTITSPHRETGEKP